MATKPIDQQKMDQFVHKVLGDTSALTTAVLGAIGEQAGLFRDLMRRDQPPAPSWPGGPGFRSATHGSGSGPWPAPAI